MTIRYALQLYNFAEGNNTFRARVIPNKRVNEQDMINAIVGMGTSLTAVDVAGVIMAQKRFIQENLLVGNAVDLSFARFSVGIKGNFDGSGDNYDENRHTIHMTTSPGYELKKTIKQEANLEKIRFKKVVPKITELKDIQTGSVNSTITPGGIAEIKGDGLKFELDDLSQGVFLITDQETEIRVEFIASNSPKKTIFLIPATLPTGTYYLAIKTGYDRENITGMSKFNLTVA